MSRLNFAVVLLASCLLFVLTDAQKLVSLNKDTGDEERPHILPVPMPDPVDQQHQPQIQIQPPVPSNPESSSVIAEDSGSGKIRQRRQSQGEGYANANNYNYPQRQPNSVGGQRYFFPLLPGWPWPGQGGSNTRPKPGNCSRPTNQYSSGSNSFGGGFPIGTNGQQGGNRPTTRPTTQRPRCRYDNDCPGNKKCCSGNCATPSFQG